MSKCAASACSLIRHASRKTSHLSFGFRPACRASSSSASSSSNATRQWSTPLSKTLAEAITTTGPITIAQFMRQCLVSDLGGYYTKDANEGQDQFGTRGDFITSPEISQVFGELVGIWFVTEWISQGKRKKGVQLVELGPGRGTLMEDALRAISRFDAMASAVEKIILVEASAALRETQRLRLCSKGAAMQELSHGFECESKHLPGVKILWVEDLKFVPQSTEKTTKMPLIVAHEFFDALPIHAFQTVSQPLTESNTTTRPTKAPENAWRELLVSPTAPPSVSSTSASAGNGGGTTDTASLLESNPSPEFELTVSRTPTRYSSYLPRLSPRYEALRSIPGATIEISPDARAITAILSQLIGPPPPSPSATSKSPKPDARDDSSTNRGGSEPAGAALIIDYGPASTVPISTLRGIRNHKLCSPFSSPGLVDVSADVDFGSIVEAALEASQDVEVHGPVEQGDWLLAMGGSERIQRLISRAPDKETAARLTSGWQRLIGKQPNGMGKLYKVISILPFAGGRRRPVGFGGGVAE